MDFGVSFQSHIHKSWKHAMLAEQMGLTQLVISPPWGYVEESLVEFAWKIIVNYEQ